MSTDKQQPKVDEQPGQEKPNQDEPRAPQNPTSINARPDQRTTPGRKPLFRH